MLGQEHGGPDDHGAQDGQDGSMGRLSLQITNQGTAAALENKLTLVNAADGSRILPAYYSDNYISLLPGETREIEIDYPLAGAAAGATPALHLRGWNLVQRTVKVAVER